ncbi:UDP-glycosyltransferase 89B1 [Acorus calamus]|uniref:UDP-glycosyltransferase 89B1 n=1 Tax=Acorus calamus TaxID=4465 RepID=A0AAV9D988_ACOCL|nr:UDP-glycosyltransferase 89B1 [Acorus calamus]
MLAQVPSRVRSFNGPRPMKAHFNRVGYLPGLTRDSRASLAYHVWFSRLLEPSLFEHLPKRAVPVGFPDLPGSPMFPWHQLPDIIYHYRDGDRTSEFIRDGMLDNVTSWGIIINSFAMLEDELGSDQVKAIAAAIELSGVRFLWAYKGGDDGGHEGRVGKRGLVIRGWAPQVAILGN